MCENAYLSIKNPKASRALKRALDPGRRMLASLARLRFATSATFGLRSWGPPLTKSWRPLRLYKTKKNSLQQLSILVHVYNQLYKILSYIAIGGLVNNLNKELFPWINLYEIQYSLFETSFHFLTHIVFSCY